MSLFLKPSGVVVLTVTVVPLSLMLPMKAGEFDGMKSPLPL